ncbi:MAG: PD-(D/E)XK nuclease family protein [Candidatus Kapabacteria bacterium]|nr:PD-(D/E)XK nuclease family protein [Candidatus Kapabacteria bacterium]
MAQILYNKNFHNFDLMKSIYSAIDAMVVDNSLNSSIVIVPTGKISRIVKDYSVKKYWELHKRPVPEPMIMTLQAFAIRIFNLSGLNKDKKIISDAFRLALFEQAIDQTETEYYKFRGKSYSLPMIERISSLIFGLKEDGIDVFDFKKDLSEKNSNIEDLQRFTDIYLIYQEYQKLLGSKLLDLPELLKLIVSEFSSAYSNYLSELFPETESPQKRSLGAIFNKITKILCFGFSEFKAPEVDIIRLFASSEIPFALNLDYSSENGPLFGNLRNSIETLIGAGFSIVDEQPFFPTEENSCILIANYIRRWLFNTEKDIQHPAIAAMIQLFSVPDKVTEVRFIAKYIKDLISDKNYKVGEICVAMRHPEEYSQLFREIFSEAKIPLNLTDRYNLDSSPLIVAIDSALQLINKNFQKADLQRVILSPYIKIYDKENDQTVDKFNYIQILNNERILPGFNRGGSGRIFEKLQMVRSSIEKQIEYNSSTDDEFLINDLKYRLNNVKSAISDTLLLMSIFKFERKKYSPIEFADFVKNLVQKLGILESVNEYYSKINSDLNDFDKMAFYDEIEKLSRAFSVFIDLLEEITFVQEQLYPGSSYNFNELYDKLRISISGARYQTHEKFGYGVTVTSIEQTRYVPFKVSILCGAVDSSFPPVYRSDTMLGKELPESAERFIQAERMLFYQFLTNNSEALENGSKKIIITYPKFRNLEELVPSQFLYSLIKIIKKNNDSDFISVDNISTYFSNDEYDQLFCSSNEFYSNPNHKNNEFDESAELKHCIEKIEKLESFNSEISIDEIIRFAGSKPDDLLAKICEQPFSASYFDNYVRCPFQFYISSILKIKTPKVTELGISSIETGIVIHKILSDFYKQIQIKEYPSIGNGIYPVHLDNYDHEVALKLLLEIADHELLAFKHHNALMKIEVLNMLGWNFDKINNNGSKKENNLDPDFNYTSDRSGILQQWLKNEILRLEIGWKYLPSFFEFEFGTNDSNQYSQPIKLSDKVYIRGKIDRIEIRETDTGFGFIVADYKTGKSGIHSEKEIMKNESFQLPLYMAAAAKLLENKYGQKFVFGGAVYYVLFLKDEQSESDQDKFEKKLFENSQQVRFAAEFSELYNIFKKNPNRYYTSEEIEDMINSSIEAAGDIMDKIKLAKFNVKPKNTQICRTCSFQGLCRIKKRK